MPKLCHFCNNEMILEHEENKNVSDGQKKSDLDKSQKILNTFLEKKNGVKVTNYECPSCGITESHMVI
ncbi:hypothetical protein HY745_06655 [Candidatus Desantisbacteria bacterium]|nr:hypothetical protein [Candidatus Desantisbacteria bacterium]